jgi:hypothetical protein
LVVQSWMQIRKKERKKESSVISWCTITHNELPPIVHNYLAFQYFDIERIWLRLFQRLVCTINSYLCFYFYYIFKYCCKYFFSEKFQNLQRTSDEQNEKISEYERQKLENKGRIFLKEQKLQNTSSNTTHSTYTF